jgi:hypothetical protein
MSLQVLTNEELVQRTLKLAARLRIFQAGADEGRNELLDKTLPGWSEKSRASGFRRTTQSLQALHHEVQKDFASGFGEEARELQHELMFRLGIAPDADAPPLHYDAADHLEQLARQLSARGAGARKNGQLPGK